MRFSRTRRSHRRLAGLVACLLWPGGARAQSEGAPLKGTDVDSDERVESVDRVDRRGFWGAGCDGLLWDLPSAPSGHNYELGAAPFVRLSAALSEHTRFRVDTALGALWAPCDQCQSTDVAFAIRMDIEFAVSSVYSVSLGMDHGFDWWLLTFSGAKAPALRDMYFVLGTHFSPLTFRFGARRQYAIAATEGVFVAIHIGSQPSFPALSQSIGFSYLFEPPPAR